MIDQSAPLTKPKSSHSVISTEPPHNGFTHYPNSTDLSFELRIATLANFSIQQKFNNIGKAIRPGITSKIERISPFLEAPVALVYATLPTVPGWRGPSNLDPVALS
jgi:hypothetical protein